VGSKVKTDLDFSVLVLLNRFIIKGEKNYDYCHTVTLRPAQRAYGPEGTVNPEPPNPEPLFPEPMNPFFVDRAPPKS